MKEATHIFFVAGFFHYLLFGYVGCKGCRTSPLWMVWSSQARTRTPGRKRLTRDNALDFFAATVLHYNIFGYRGYWTSPFRMV